MAHPTELVQLTALARTQVEVDVFASGVLGGHAIRKVAFDEHTDRIGDLANDVLHPDIGVRRNDAQRSHVAAEEISLARSELLPIDVRGVRALKKRVIHVSDVLRVVNGNAGLLERPHERVEREIGGRVAEVSRVVRRDAAHVQPRNPILGFHRLDLLSRCVEERYGDAVT